MTHKCRTDGPPVARPGFPLRAALCGGYFFATDLTIDEYSPACILQNYVRLGLPPIFQAMPF